MKPKINYHYTIYHKEVDTFNFIQYNYLVDETCYYDRVMTHINTIIEHLLDRPNSRQEVIVTHKQFKNYACLISLQFQIVNNRLVVIANFRSQCAINGRPNDTPMLQYIATQVMRRVGVRRFIIYVNVGNYHENLGLNV